MLMGHRQGQKVVLLTNQTLSFNKQGQSDTDQLRITLKRHADSVARDHTQETRSVTNVQIWDIYVPALLPIGSPHCEFSIIINDVHGSIYVNKTKTVVVC